MILLQNIFLFVFGLCVGSFINCLVYRLNHNRSPLRGRSICPNCKHKLAWRDNIPLLSFILLRGKCRFCHSPISWQYPLVELATGILTLFVVFHLGGVLVTGYWLLVTYSLIALFVSDLRYQTVPDEIVYPTMGLAFFWSLVTGYWLLPLAGFGAAVFFWLLVLVTRGKGMGMGDVKLAGLMGLVLGFPKIIVALMMAFLTGAIVGVILVITRKKHFGEQIPFGPFLTAATWISLFWGQIIWQFYVERVFL